MPGSRKMDAKRLHPLMPLTPDWIILRCGSDLSITRRPQPADLASPTFPRMANGTASALLKLNVYDSGLAAHTYQNVEMIGHQTIGDDLHTGESDLLPEQPAQLLFAQIIEQKLTAHDSRNTVIRSNAILITTSLKRLLGTSTYSRDPSTTLNLSLFLFCETGVGTEGPVSIVEITHQGSGTTLSWAERGLFARRSHCL